MANHKAEENAMSSFLELVNSHPHTPGHGSRSREYIQRLIDAHVEEHSAWDVRVAIGALGLTLLSKDVDWALYDEIAAVANEWGQPWKVDRWLLEQVTIALIRKALVATGRDGKP